MFNLEQAVAEWRGRLAKAGVRSPKILDELESHLREEIEKQTKLGVGFERAFTVALQNLGPADAIKNEFGKTDGFSAVTGRLMLGICVLLVGLISLLSAFAVFVCYTAWSDRLMAGLAIFCVLLVACRWRYAVPFLPEIGNPRKRLAAGLGCIGLGVILCNLFIGFVLPFFEYKADKQLPAIGIWAVFIVAVFACAGVGLTLSEQERKARGMTRGRRSD